MKKPKKYIKQIKSDRKFFKTLMRTTHESRQNTKRLTKQYVKKRYRRGLQIRKYLKIVSLKLKILEIKKFLENLKNKIERK